MNFRTEKDSLGPRKVPADAYYGVQTVRALENFQITGIPVSHFTRLIQALACVKKAAALANMELGLLPDDICDAIVQAARDVREGRLDEHFPVDVIQGGAGTSVNMNANEVICNRALEIIGAERGDYSRIHPNNHVNLSQSTNDVYPTALKIALIWYCQDLLKEMEALVASLRAKGEEFADVIKMGRTQLQDAVPMTLGQEFAAYSVTVGEDISRLREAITLLRESNMGATAIGTGINTVEGYAEAVCRYLADVTGLDIVPAENLVEATSDTGVFVHVSGILKRISVKLSKICNDLRLLSSGPFTGFHEINLPPMQPGSSIMPGKVNPVIPEAVNQVCYQVIGNDVTVTMAAEAGQLELNVFEPIIAFNLFQSVDMLARAAFMLRKRCIDGITANRERCAALVRMSVGAVTALAPYIGYEAAAALAKESECTGRALIDLVVEQGHMSRDEAQKVLDPLTMTRPKPGAMRD
ncbi:aspartate ammonia-lyase [Desulfobaculum xiamenense]|uniref:Aspartate ammonia-lyase n=1 Tax=Desulfobaculum xiamenense TaxID=995050 RepID=A0A846QKA1_9BACT|nr:aspartate ammonia-lyase [Desulfobaculum xiamenense]NJB68628.1 aspartate ammonia-lyase [Desulfobaculum xiamenense]